MRNPRLSILTNELNLIQNDDIRMFTESVLDSASEKFWRMPASSTNKYHPRTSQGVGGLVRHTRQVTNLANAIMETQLYDDRTTGRMVDRDVVISACILHDSWKYSPHNHSKYTVRYHGLLAYEEITNLFRATIATSRVKERLYLILRCIVTHNGKFTNEIEKIDNHSNALFRMTPEQKIVCSADYISSRKWNLFDELET